MTPDDIAAALRESGGVISKAAGRLNVDRRRLSERIQRDPELVALLRSRPKRAASVRVNGDHASVTTGEMPADVSLGDMEQMLRERGLDPADWRVEFATVNEWDGADGEKKRQLKLSLRRSAQTTFVFPAVDVAPRPMAVAAQPGEAPLRVALLPDPHCPLHDRELHKRMLQHLHEWQPHRVVNLGDLCDFPTISRHRDNPAWASTVQENIQAGFEWWSDVIAAVPSAERYQLEGNHDARLRTELLGRAERMYGIRPADIPGRPSGHDALSLHELLHFDQLGVTFVGPPREGDNYFHGNLDLADDVCVRHGWLTGTASARGSMERLNMSVYFGHTHHQRMHFRTVYKGSRAVGQQVGIECGVLKDIRGGGGYAVNPDWQPGYATSVIWPDGTHVPEFARFDGRSLTWRDRRY